MTRATLCTPTTTSRPTIVTGSNTDIMALKDARCVLDTTNRRLGAVIDNFREGIVLED